MPKLKNLRVSSPSLIASRFEIEAMEISDVACKYLETLYFGGYSPSKLLTTIGNQCPKLTRCDFSLHNVNDNDLSALSRCQRIVSFSLRYPIPITNGLSCLTNLPQLADLDLHYSLGKYIDTRLLLDFTRSCPRLDTISVADYNRNTTSFDPKAPFEVKAISELFATGAELGAYFEPHYTGPSAWDRQRLSKYLIRINNLRSAL